MSLEFQIHTEAVGIATKVHACPGVVDVASLSQQFHVRFVEV